MELEPGSTFGAFKIVQLLGQGGMASVYLAEQQHPTRRVALKLIDPVLSKTPPLRARFHREANILALLEHPAIVPIWESGEVDGQLYISSRYIDGGTLRDLMDVPLAPETVVGYLRPVAEGLDFAHRRGVVHRDIKPANILVTTADDDGRRQCIITDFGIARMLADPDVVATYVTMPGVSLGTTAYMAPEQLAGDEIDGRCDQYALAIVAYQMLTGTVPFTGTPSEVVAKITTMPPRPPSAVNESITAPVDRVFSKVLAKLPEDRYPSCVAFINALEAATERTQFVPVARPAPAASAALAAAVSSPAGTPPVAAPSGGLPPRSMPPPPPPVAGPPSSAGGAPPVVVLPRRRLAIGLAAVIGVGVVALVVLGIVLATRKHGGQTTAKTIATATVTQAATASATATAAVGAPTPAPTAAPRTPTPASTAQASATPLVGQALLGTLQRLPWGPELPDKFSVSKQQSINPTTEASQSHALGAVEFTMNGPDDHDFVDFVVFGNHANALQYLNSVGDKNRSVATVSEPSGCAQNADPANGKPEGWTICYVVSGDTVVRASTGVYGTQASGNGDNTNLLAQAGLAHHIGLLLSQVSLGPNEFPLPLRGTNLAEGKSTTAGQQRHVLSVLYVTMQGPDVLDEIDYYVFPTSQDAAGYLRDRGASVDSSLRDLGLPYSCLNFQSDKPNTGQSSCYVQIGTLVVRSVTEASGSATQGNMSNAVLIARAGVRHFQGIVAE